jgi:hypothetical protein
LEIIGSHQKSSRHIQWRAATKDQEWAASQMELLDEKMHGVGMKLFIHSASPQRTNDAHQPVDPTFGEAIWIRIHITYIESISIIAWYWYEIRFKLLFILTFSFH